MIYFSDHTDITGMNQEQTRELGESFDTQIHAYLAEVHLLRAQRNTAGPEVTHGWGALDASGSALGF